MGTCQFDEVCAIADTSKSGAEGISFGTTSMTYSVINPSVPATKSVGLSE